MGALMQNRSYKWRCGWMLRLMGIGMEDLATIYMKDDVVYANIMDMQKEYMPLDDKMLSKLNLDKETGNLKTNAEKAFEEMSIERKDGKKIITAVLNKNSLKSAKSYANKSINDDTFNIGDGIKVTDVSEAAYIMTVNEQNQLERLEMKITAAYVMEDADENKKTAVMDNKYVFEHQRYQSSRYH